MYFVCDDTSDIVSTFYESFTDRCSRTIHSPTREMIAKRWTRHLRHVTSDLYVIVNQLEHRMTESSLDRQLVATITGNKKFVRDSGRVDENAMKRSTSFGE